MHFARALLLLVVLVIGANAQEGTRIQCSTSHSEDRMYIVVQCTVNGEEFTGKARYSLNGGSFSNTDMPFSINLDVLNDTNTLDLQIKLTDDAAYTTIPTLTVEVSRDITSTSIKCSTRSDGSHVVVSCTVNDVTFTGNGSYSINQTAQVLGSFPLWIPLADFRQGRNTLDLELEVGGRIVPFQVVITLRTTPSTSIKCSTRSEEDHIVVSCTVNDVTFTGNGSYSINQTAQVSGSFPLWIPLANFQQGPNILDLNLEVGGRIIPFQAVITLSTTQGFQVLCRGTFVDNELQINCEAASGGQTITSVTYSFNDISQEVDAEDLPISIPVSDLIEDNTTIVLVITGSGGSQLTTSLEVTKPKSFQVVCKGIFVEDELQINCEAISGDQTITSVTYSLNSGNKMEVRADQLPISIQVSQLNDSLNIIDLNITGSEGSLLTITLEIVKPIECTTTLSGNQITIACSGGIGVVTSYKYIINSESEMTDLRLPITISRTAEGIVVGFNRIEVVLLDGDDNEVYRETLIVQVPSQEPFNLEIPLTFLVFERSLNSILRFGIIDTSVGAIPFSVEPLTYREFETITGTLVEDLFPVVPPAAGAGDISATGSRSYSFGPAGHLLAEDYTYNVSAALNNDEEEETNEGFILWFDFDESRIDPADLSRLSNVRRAILVTIFDDDGPVVPLEITCMEITDTFIGGIGSCTTSGGLGIITFTCRTDDDSEFRTCKFPVIINFFDVELGRHTLTVVATDSLGATVTFTYSYVGQRPPDLILAVSPRSIVVGEDGTGEVVSISKIGYSFSSVSFALRPMTYSEYLDSEDNLDQLFPFRPPIEASSADFDSSTPSHTFSAGLLPQPSFSFPGSLLAVSDSIPEFTEGLVLSLEVDESSLDDRDRNRLKVLNPLVLVSIRSNGLVLDCTTAGNVLQSLSLSCSGPLPSVVVSLQCFINGISRDCTQFPFTFDTSTISTGTYTVVVSGITSSGGTIAVGEATFSVPEIDLYFINDTPVLVGGTVISQFTADRAGLVYQCHLTHFDDIGFREDCSSGVYNRTGMPHGDYTLRVIATDPIREDRQVIRSRLWVHSEDANDPYCILYLRNRGWRVVNDTFIVDFAGTGAASRPDAAFECSLDRTTHVPCSSPYVLTGLSPGVHHVRVRPTTCGRDYRVWNKRFTIV